MEMTTDQIREGAKIINKALSYLRAMDETTEDDVRGVLMAYYSPGMDVDDIVDVAIGRLMEIDGPGAP